MNFENQSTFGEVMGNIIVACFFIDSQCTMYTASGKSDTIFCP